MRFNYLERIFIDVKGDYLSNIKLISDRIKKGEKMKSFLAFLMNIII
jgi:hypothetical protein